MASIPADREADPPKGSLLAGASWLMAAKTISFAITIVLPLLLSRRLSIAEFGYYKQLFLLLTSATSLLPFGMNMSLFYFLPRARNRTEKGNIVLAVMMFYLLSTCVAGAAIAWNPALLQVLFHSSALATLAPRIGLTLIPYVIATLIEFILVANGDNRISAAAIVSVNLARTLLILAAVLIWGNISAILWAVSILSVIQTLWLLNYIFQKFGRFWEGFHWGALLSQLSYALPLGMAGLLWSLQVDIDNYFVSHYFDAAMFAIYAAGCFDVPLVGMLAESVGSVLIPRISGLQANDSHPEIVSLTVRAMRALAFVYAPVFTFLFLAANQVIGILYPARFLSSVPIFRVNLLMVPLAVVAVDPIVRAFKSERFWMLKMNIALLAIQCAGLVFSIQRFGLIGAIFCVVAIQYTARTLVAWRVSGILGVRRSDLRPLKDVALMFGAAAFAGLCIAGILGPAGTWAASLAASLGNEAARRFLSSGFSLALCGSIFSALYLAALFALKVPTESEVQWCWSSALRVARIRTK